MDWGDDDNNKKVLNNNVVLVENDIGDDFILIGTGIGFNKKNGEKVDKTKAEKKFNFENSYTEKLSSVLNEIPIDYIKLVSDIVHTYEGKSHNKISNSIYISLSDHIYHVVKLWKQNLTNSNYLLWEIRKFYPEEYAIGEEAVKRINQDFCVDIPESEAGNIALHLINAQFTCDNSLTKQPSENIAKKIKDILSIIIYSTNQEIDESSLSYERFITHLRYFFKNFEKKKKENKSNPILTSFKKEFPLAFKTMKKVESYLEIELDESNQLYLCIHIQRLIE